MTTGRWWSWTTWGILEIKEAEAISCTAKMKLYLDFTNLVTKRMLGATKVEPRPAESEVTGSKRYRVEEIFGDDKDMDLSVEGANISVVDTNIVTVSVKDTDMSPVSLGKDIQNSEPNKTQDIFYNLKEYKAEECVRFKRRFGDEGRWWLPPSWTVRSRPSWPSSGSTSRSRQGGWSRRTDPDRVNILEEEKIRHKLLWRDFKLTDGDEGHGDDGDCEGTQARTDGQEGGDGEVQGLEVQPEVGRGPEHGVESNSERQGPSQVAFQDDRDQVDTKPEVPEQGAPAHHHGDVPEGGHGSADGQQCSRKIIVKRKYRLPDGATRDSKTQLSIQNFTFKSGRGDISIKNSGGLLGVAPNSVRSAGPEDYVKVNTD